MSKSNYIPSTYPGHCEKELVKICEHTLSRLKDENHVNIMDESVAYTVVEVFLENVATWLKDHPDDVIEIASLLKFSTVKDSSDNGEKGGNIVPMVEIGEKFKLGVKNDEATEEDDE